MNPFEDASLTPADLKRLLQHARQVVSITEALKPLLKRGDEMGVHEQYAVKELLRKIADASGHGWEIMVNHTSKQYERERQLNGAVTAAK